MNNSQIVFIRHAESRYNDAVVHYRRQLQSNYTWQNLVKDSYFLDKIKYSHDLIDADITEEGQKQCQIAYGQLKQYKPDIILVSPLNRALNTCNRIFKNSQCPIIIQPLLSERVTSTCDINCQTSQKKLAYPHFNFDKLQKQGDIWFINNQSETHKQILFKIIQNNKDNQWNQCLKEIIKHMRKVLFYEQNSHFRQRTNKIRDLLKQYATKYEKIVVISHYNTIRYTIAQKFDQKDQTSHIQIQNCSILKSHQSKL